jgi:hypothetical protein
MEANHAYLFRLYVESSVIRVHYRTAEWEGEYDTGGDLGQNDSDWIELGMWSGPNGWEEHDMNGSNDDIGNE